MNLNFGYISADGVFSYAEDCATVDGVVYSSPKAEHYAAMDPPRLPLVTDNQPSAADGVVYYPSGWQYNDDMTAILRVWSAQRATQDDPVTPDVHRYSKLKLIVAAKTLGKWDALKEWIASAGYEDEWSACMFLASDYAGFDQIKAAIISAGVATAEQVAAILDAAEDDSLQGV